MLALLSVVSVLVTANESFAALQCYQCHGDNVADALPLDTPAGSPASYRNITTGAVKGNHQTHLNGLNITSTNQSMCARCHNNSGYTASHRSGTITLNKAINASPLATGYNGAGMQDGGSFVFKNQTSVPVLGSCSNVNCHFETATPSWGSSAASVTCDTCHAAQPSTLSHSAHTAQYGGTASCVKCHADHTGSFQHATSAGNAGRNIDLSKMTGTYTGSNFMYLPSQLGTPRVTGSCGTNVCHSTGQSADGLSATPVYRAGVIWSNAGTGACSTCHPVSGIATGSHAKHVASDSNCGNCHAGATSASINSLTHVDGQINVEFGTYNRNGAPGNGYGTCSTATCHNNGQIGVQPATPTWGVIQGACTVCHAASPVTGSHTKHLTGTAYKSTTCGDCHAGSVALSNGGSYHLDGDIDVTTGMGYNTNIAKHAAGVYTTGGACSTSYCHSSGQAANGLAGNPVYGTAPTWGGTAACGSCHATSGLATGSHTKHLASSTNCGSCHTNSTLAAYNNATHIDGQIDVAATLTYTAAGAPGNGYGTCSTNSCHNNGQSTGSTATATWGNIIAACTACHAATPATGAHVKHMTGTAFKAAVCGDCHTNAVAGSNGGSFHLDNDIDVATGLGYPTNIAKHVAGTYTGSCSTSYCHSSGQAANGLAGLPVYGPTPTWGATITGCNSCHLGTTIATGSHTKHISSGANCGSCHLGATNTTYGATTHVDGQINVDALQSYNAAGAPGNGYGTCATSSCHNNGQTGVQPATPTWGTTATACTVCHLATPTTGSHTKHVSGSLYKLSTCDNCHIGATAGVSGGAQHIDGNTDVGTTLIQPGALAVVPLGYNNNIAPHAAGNYTTGGSCSTTWCHSSGQGATGGAVTPIYATTAPTWGSTVVCGSCHATSGLTTGGHTKHLAFSTNCGGCHAGATLAAYNGVTHVDGSIDVAAGLAYTAAGAPGNGYGRCTTNTCHSNGTTAAATATPTWGNTVAACTVCHASTTIATGSHATHLTGTRFKAMSCNACHAGAVAGSNGGPRHLDGLNFVNISASLPGVNYASKKLDVAVHAAGSYTTTCSTIYCHGSSLQAGLTPKTVPTWGGAAQTCNSCHGAPPNNTDHTSATATNCSMCHSHVNSNGSGFVDATKHVNGIIEGGRCDACHGYPPVSSQISKTGTGLGHMGNYTGARYQNYSGGGGVHSVAGHLALNIKPDDQFSPCATCHPSTALTHNEGFGQFSTHNVQVVIQAKFKFDKSRPIVYNAKQSGTGKTSGTCSNVECHFRKSPIWSSETYTQRH
jgi:predicted CxxxxCH...CXXCH cytochrome family protein